MSLPVILTIAGSDNSAGAGAQADLKTITALGGYALTAITCVVAEVPGKVSAIQPIAPEIVAEQIRLSCAAFPVAAVKTGMLYSREIIEAVLAALPACPLVVDPVMIATSGDPLLREDAIALYRERLLPRATLATPNLDEARVLLGAPIPDLDAMRDAGPALVAKFGTAFLLKGGHLRGSTAIDLLFLRDGAVHEYAAPFVPGVSTHGTGCTTSAAIATGLARGLDLPAAVGEAKQFVTRAITNFLRWGSTDALHHFAPRA
ncbi:MAG: bifunctional hydroxymethylpyrimidine kinase/phosphomethylpyrimidine kinase [Chthoniobacteraceae bacterium]